MTHTPNFLPEFDNKLMQNAVFKAKWTVEAPYREVVTACFQMRSQQDMTQAQLAKRLKIPFPIFKLMESFNYKEVPDYCFVQAADKLGLPFEMTWKLKQAL